MEPFVFLMFGVVPMGELSKFEPEDLIRILDFLEIVEPNVELKE